MLPSKLISYNECSLESMSSHYMMSEISATKIIYTLLRVMLSRIILAVFHEV